MLQAFHQARHVVHGMETQTMHACVQLDMHRKAGHALGFCRMDKRVKKSEVVHLGFEMIAEQRAEATHLGVHHHDVRGDTRAPQCGAFISHRHGQIVHTTVLQRA